MKLQQHSFSREKKAIIIGAGPAGLPAASELLCRSDVIPVILEKSSYMGSISRNVNYGGNRIDLGGHRFFSKSDRVMNGWLQYLRLEARAGGSYDIAYQQQRREIAVADVFSNADGCTLLLGRTAFSSMVDKSARFRLYGPNNPSSVCMTEPRYDQIVGSERGRLLLPNYLAFSPLRSMELVPEWVSYRDNTRTPSLQFVCPSIC